MVIGDAPVELGPKANPADTQYVPRPEWYYIPVFQWLKYWESGLAVLAQLPRFSEQDALFSMT